MAERQKTNKETKTMNRLKLLCVTASLALLGLAGTASSADAAPVWRLWPAADTFAAPGTQLRYDLEVFNVGDAPSSGEYQVTTTLPAGVVADSVDAESEAGGWACTGNGPSPAPSVEGASTILCTTGSEVFPLLRNFTSLGLIANIDPSASGTLRASFEIAGGEASQVGGAPCAQAPSFAGAPCSVAAETTMVTGEPPQFGIDSFDTAVSADGAGSAFTKAGGHPYQVSTWLDLNTHRHPVYGLYYPVEPLKGVSVDLPPGFVGSTTDLGQCPLAKLSPPPGVANPQCPPESQVGLADFSSADGRPDHQPFRSSTSFVPIFNLETSPEVPARFGFNVFGTVVVLDASVRSGSDYGLTVSSRNTPEGLALFGSSLTFWGYPADSSHNFLRFCPEGGIGCTSKAPNKPLFRMPTSCTAPGSGLQTLVHVESWVDPGDVKTAATESHLPPGYPADPSDWGAPQGPEGCQQLRFEPTIKIQPTRQAASTPTGLAVDLTMPQEDDPATGLAPSDLKKAVVTLPEGMTVNAAAANGLGACTAAQIDLHGENTEPTCPDSAKIGSVTIDTPLLDEQLDGDVYLAKQGDNPFGSLLAFYLVARGPGTVIKLAGRVSADPVTGRLTTTFDNQPQLPFEKLHLDFFGGPQAALMTPPTCGSFSTTSELTPWSGAAPVASSNSFSIVSGPDGTPCPNGLAGRPFDPKLSGGSVNPVAGATSPFVMRLTRTDAEQRFSTITAMPPAGLSAYLKSVPYCPQSALDAVSATPGTGAAQLASPGCPAASQIGTVSAGAGAGPLPFYVNTGRVYLAGPYKGAPLSLAIVVPAVAGPLDLGSVLTRAAVNVDPTTARLTVVSDPLPQMLEGIPLDVRDVRVNIDRADFALNPTSCAAMSIASRLNGADGATASPSQRYQLADCGALGFRPDLALRLKGKTKRSGFPALSATLKMPKANSANIASARVTLPPGLQVENAHIQTPCTRVQFAAAACPPKSVLGFARAFSPLLDKPLEGPVYFRANGGEHPLPDLVADLNGQIHVVLVGHIDAITKKGVTRIRNTFETVPDAPVSKFTLSLLGGKRGYLVNNRNLCREAQKALVQFDAQNGKFADSNVVMGTSCGKGKKHRRR